MSTMQRLARALLDETDPDTRAAMSRQLAGMVLRLLCPTDDDTEQPVAATATPLLLPEPDEDQVPF
jgi:hypothetical protein